MKIQILKNEKGDYVKSHHETRRGLKENKKFEWHLKRAKLYESAAKMNGIKFKLKILEREA